METDYTIHPKKEGGDTLYILIPHFVRKRLKITPTTLLKVKLEVKEE